MRKSLLLTAAAVLFTASAAMAAGKGQPKVPICHHGIDETTGEPTIEIISVSNQAVAKHIANHGDNEVGAEVCDGVDNDCNGIIDDNPTDVGGTCNTGEPGVCARGVERCIDGELLCAPLQEPGPEVCDERDNDCDGNIDEDGVCNGAAFVLCDCRSPDGLSSRSFSACAPGGCASGPEYCAAQCPTGWSIHVLNCSPIPGPCPF